MVNIKSQIKEGCTVFFRCGGRTTISRYFFDEDCGKTSSGEKHVGQMVVFGEVGHGGPAHYYRNDGQYYNYPKGDSQHPFDIVEIRQNILRIVKS